MLYTYHQAGFQLGAFSHLPDHLLKHLSSFTLGSSQPLESQKPCPYITVLSNLLKRGIPTRPNLFVEESFATTFDKTVRNVNSIGSIEYKWSTEIDSEEFNEAVIKALHIIEPRLRPQDININDYDHQSEKDFREKIFPNAFGPYAAQLLETQRPLESILNYSEDKKERQKSILGRLEARFYRQRVDFTLQRPDQKGIVVEIDGKQHQDADQRELDAKRRGALKNQGWQLARIPAFKPISPTQKEDIAKVLESSYFRVVEENYANPLWATQEGLEALQFALTPFGIARIQLALLQLMQSGILNLQGQAWKILIYERDVPCAHLAIEDLKQQFHNLSLISGTPLQLPPIHLSVVTTPEFKASGLHQHFPVKLLSELDSTVDADAVIDISLLERGGLSGLSQELLEKVNAPIKVCIRSCYGTENTRCFSSAAPIHYPSLLDTQHPERLDGLRYFLQNIFRKTDFRDGQLQIIDRVMQQQDVIGLLPTGAGKSLTYQIPALLQPGITMVIDPIKALMFDQVDNLKKSGIDACCFINSALNTVQRQEVQTNLGKGAYLFSFVSPERLQIQEFRDYLLSLEKLHFAYCIIDEAHCVSEWGHDFRTAYLRLADNARKYCKHFENKIPMVALTGTASFDVLADIQRELGIGSDGVITPPTYERKELHFHILPCDANEVAGFKSTKEAVAFSKNQALVNLIREMPDYFEKQDDFFQQAGEDSNAGLVFCPHVNGVFGVKEVATYLKDTLPELQNTIGIFAGSADDTSPDALSAQETQEHYKDNKMNLLVATKAFGMGVDKPNIRFTIHFSMPPSIESFYQEAGRAGRDRKDSHCFVLFSDAKEKDNHYGEITVDKGLMLSFHSNSYRGELKEILILKELLSQPIVIQETEYPSISVLLSRMKHNQEAQIVVPYENTAFENILNYLKVNVSNQFSEYHMRRALKFCKSLDEFIEKIGREYYRETRSWPYKTEHYKDLENALKADFEALRLEGDTYKAIYRLSLVGLITDYVVNYGSKTITARIRKRTDDEYITILAQYISRYVSAQSAQKVPEKIQSLPGTALSQCIRYLIGFIYGNIARKREEAINVMERAIQQTLAGGDFKEYVNTYFDSRYTTVLRPFLYDYSLESLWETMEESNGEPDALKHLLGGTNRLLVENPENPIFLLLRSFSALLLGERTTGSEDDFIKGWEVVRREELSSTLSKDMERFYHICLNFNADVEERLGSEIMRLHLKWLKEFNQNLTGVIQNG